jgi:hypothetical protein
LTPKPRFDKRNLLPWCDWMTIGVGVLATEPEARARNLIADHIVLMADTMGSFGDFYSHPRLHKVFTYPDNKFYATAADMIDRAAELVVCIDKTLRNVPHNVRNYGNIQFAIGLATYLYKVDRFRLEVYPEHRIPPEPIDSRLITDPALQAELQSRWQTFRLECDLLVGAFDCDGRGYLFHITGDDAKVQNVSYPGFAAIGVVDNTMFWLSRRAHTMGMTLKRAAYHAYEAKLMAEKAAHVNEHIDMLIANKDRFWFVSTHRMRDKNLSKGCPVSLKQLEQWFKRYGPRDTSDLDGAKAKTNPRSNGGRKAR